MIIGNSFNNQNNNFQSKMEDIKNNNNLLKDNNVNPFRDDPNSPEYTDASSKKSMYDKTLAMLHTRLENGTISLDDFNRECQKLNKLRNKE